MNCEALNTYVRSALQLQGYVLDEASVQEVSLQFERIAAIAQALESVVLPLEVEPASVFRP